MCTREACLVASASLLPKTIQPARMPRCTTCLGLALPPPIPPPPTHPPPLRPLPPPTPPQPHITCLSLLADNTNRGEREVEPPSLDQASLLCLASGLPHLASLNMSLHGTRIHLDRPVVEAFARG